MPTCATYCWCSTRIRFRASASTLGLSFCSFTMLRTSWKHMSMPSIHTSRPLPDSRRYMSESFSPSLEYLMMNWSDRSGELWTEVMAVIGKNPTGWCQPLSSLADFLSSYQAQYHFFCTSGRPFCLAFSFCLFSSSLRLSSSPNSSEMLQYRMAMYTLPVSLPFLLTSRSCPSSTRASIMILFCPSHLPAGFTKPGTFSSSSMASWISSARAESESTPSTGTSGMLPPPSPSSSPSPSPFL
mmetsp:Transcript_32672/g.85774  ORF Transcript_32672/g.85774 Transcript_32672/m.85774 type:complete len:241 (-) Transcript_32672:606-1328(-)